MSTGKIDKLKNGAYHMVMFNGKQIHEIRKALGMTMVEFAKEIGVTASAVCLWESEKRHPPYRKMMKISELAERVKKAVPA